MTPAQPWQSAATSSTGVPAGTPGYLVCPAISGRRGKVHLHTSRQRPPLRRCAGRCRCWSGGRQGRSRPTLLLLAPVAVASLADCVLCWLIDSSSEMYIYISLSTYIYIYTYRYRYTHIIEGSLEVKLPTIWTDEKQSRAEAERRERSEERRVEEKE